jgi:hypothetical protein
MQTSCEPEEDMTVAFLKAFTLAFQSGAWGRAAVLFVTLTTSAICSANLAYADATATVSGLTCGEATRTGLVSLSIGWDEEIVQGASAKGFQGFDILIVKGTSAADKCRAIQEQVSRELHSLIPGQKETGIVVDVVENRVRFTGPAFPTPHHGFVTQVIVADSTSESTAVSANAPPGVNNAVAVIPAGDQHTKPAAGTRYEVAAKMGLDFCDASVTADGASSKSELSATLMSDLAGQHCDLAAHTFIDPLTHAIGTHSTFSVNPMTVFWNPDAADLFSLGVLTDLPTTPMTNYADAIVFPPDGSSILLPQGATFPITVTNNGTLPRLLNVTSYFGSPTSAFVASTIHTTTPGATVFSLAAPANNPTNVEVTVCSLEGTSSCETTGASTVTYSLVTSCPEDLTNDFTNRLIEEHYDPVSGMLEIGLSLRNTSANTFTGPLSTGLILLSGSATMPANLANRTGSAPLGCTYGGFPVIGVPMSNPLAPGDGVLVRYQIPVTGPSPFDIQSLVAFLIRF